MYVLAHPDFVQHIFQDHHEHHPRSGYVRGMLKNIMGEGLFTGDERRWRHQAPLIQPAFAPHSVAEFADVMTGRTEQLLDRWATLADTGEIVDMQSEMMELCLDVIGEILFGRDDWARHAGSAKHALVIFE